MKMRELEQRTGVDREVIRVLLRKGLLPEPERPARNMAVYGEKHVRAIGVVRELQRSSRLTLGQIGAAMSLGTVEGGAAVTTYRHLEELLAIRFGLDQSPLVAIATLAETYPSAERDARAFAGMGMLRIVEEGGAPHVSMTDARLIEIWGQVRRVGFVEETGFPPENIGFYLEAAERVAAEETRVFLAGSRGRIAEEQAAVMLQAALQLMLDFFGLLRLKAFMRNLHEAVAGGEAEGRGADQRRG